MKLIIRVLLLLTIMSGYTAQAQIGRGKITAAEYYFDTDPGQGAATALNLQGGVNEALRSAIQSASITLPAGKHTVNIRMKDSLNNWGPVFKTTLSVETTATARITGVTLARMYWDANVAGATNLIILNGNVTNAVNTFINSSAISTFPTPGDHNINVQVLDAAAQWSPVFTTTISVETPLTTTRVVSASLGRVYWDANVGAAIGLIILNGNASNVINNFVASSSLSTFSTPGDHKLNVQLLDVVGSGNYSQVFSTVISFESVLTPTQIYSAALGRAYWDNNLGSAVGLIIVNGNAGSVVNDFVSATAMSSFTTPGWHKLNVQLLDPNVGGNYGPAFTTVIKFDKAIDSIRAIRVDAARVWIDNNQAGAIPMLAFDGNFNDAIESASQALSGVAAGLHTLNVQMRDSTPSQWGPIFKTVFSAETPLSYRNINVASGQLYWDNDTLNNPQSLLAFDGVFDNAIEEALKNNVPVLPSGLHTLCVRFKDVANNWSKPFKIMITVEDSLYARNIKLTQGEVRVDNNPPITIVALNGSFSNAVEQAQASILSSGIPTGLHKLLVRFKGIGSNWGPYFTTAVLVSPCATSPQPTVTNSSTLTFCKGDSTILTASSGFSSYQWISNNTVVGTGPTLVVKDSGSYVVVVTDVTNCPGVSAPKVADVHYPSVTISSNATLCQGATDTLIATSGYTTYAWSAGSTTNKQYISAPGTYTVTVTDNIGCSATATKTISSLAAPTAPIISANGPISFCAGSNVTLTSSATSNILWNTGQTTPSITTDSTGNYSVTVTGANGCKSTSSVVHTTKFPLAVATVSTNSPLTVCAGTSVPLYATVPAQSYLWSNGATTSSISATVSGNYQVSIIDSNGCPVTSNTVSVTVNPNPAVPVISANGPLSFCNGSSVTLTSSSSINNYWNNGSTNQAITIYQSGVFVDSVTNSFGCYSKSAPVNVDVHPVATIQASGPTTLCFGDSVTLTAQPNVGVTYLWSTGSTAPSVKLSTSQLASVIVTEIGLNCKDTAFANIIVNPLPTGTITAQGPTTVCYNNNVLLAATGSPNTKYKWYFNGSPITYSIYNGNCACYNTYNVYGNSYSASTSGTYYAQVIDTLTGCTSFTNSVTITIILPPKPIITANGGTTLCIGANTVLSSTPASSYLWSNGAVTQTTVASTQGYYTVTITDNNGCTRTSDATLVTFYPVASIIPSGPTTFCANLNVSLTASPVGTYLWSNGSTAATIPNITTSGTYGLTVTDANGCVSTATPVNVVVHPLPIGSISTTGAGTACYGQSVTLNTSTVPNTIYKWYRNGSPISYSSYNINCSCYVPVYTYGYSYGATSSGNYSAEIIDTLTGCSSMTNTIPVTIYPLPTASITQSAFNQCYGNSAATITATASGTVGPYSYSWNTGATTATISGLPAANYIVHVSDIHNCGFDTNYVVTQPALVSVNATSPTNTRGYQVTCYGSTDGSATAYPSGGTGPYTYLWSTGATSQTISNIGAGTYTVTVIDAHNCLPATTTVTLTQPAQVGLTLSPHVFYGGKNIACYGDSSGSILAIPAGGTANFTFQWSNGQTTALAQHLSAGTYSVIATDSVGCSTTAGVTLTQPTPITHSLTKSLYSGYNVSCNGSTDGSLTLSVNGGTLPYHYFWSDTFYTANRSGLGAGFYMVTTTDTLGCQVTDTATLIQPTAIVTTLTGSVLNCYGDHNGTASASTIGGNSPYSYAWSNGATGANISGLSAGFYLATTTDTRGCTKVTQVEVTQPTPTTAYAFGTYIGCGTQIGLLSVTGSGGNSPYTFLWSNGSTASFQTNQPLGTYTVQMTDAHGCLDTATAIILSPPTLTATVTNYNASCDSITTVPAGAVSVSVTGGVPPYMYLWSNGETTPSINNLTSGIYTCIVTDANGCTITPTAHAFNNDPIQIFGEDTICFGTLANLSTIPGSNFQWTKFGTLVGTTPQVSVGQGPYILTMNNLNGCPQSDTINIMAVECMTNLKLKAFIQGYYESFNTMRSVLLNQGESINPLVADSIDVEFRDANYPYPLVTSVKTLLQSNGQALCFLNYLTDTCYVVIKHRNGLETWSANPVVLKPTPTPTNYDFTVSANKAYGDNQIQVGVNQWAFYSGDINQDGAIDAFDYILLDPDIISGNSGYLTTDLNGDGSVDAFDYLILDPNVINGIGAMAP